MTDNSQVKFGQDGPPHGQVPVAVATHVPLDTTRAVLACRLESHKWALGRARQRPTPSAWVRVLHAHRRRSEKQFIRGRMAALVWGEWASVSSRYSVGRKHTDLLVGHHLSPLPIVGNESVPRARLESMAGGVQVTAGGVGRVSDDQNQDRFRVRLKTREFLPAMWSEADRLSLCDRQGGRLRRHGRDISGGDRHFCRWFCHWAVAR